MPFNRLKEYSQVPEDDPSTTLHHRERKVNRMTSLILVLASFAAGFFGFFAAQSLFSHSTSEVPLQLETIEHTFQYNRSFSYPPSNHTNRAWREIFPEEGGFFVHPTIAPTRSTFSVFHQLHCMNALRGGYWASHKAALRGKQIVDEDLPVDIQESHMRHCIDLIRQSLMCLADTTLEVVDEKINGVHGFRTPHQCKNWEQLKEWTSDQQRRQHVEQIV